MTMQSPLLHWTNINSSAEYEEMSLNKVLLSGPDLPFSENNM